METRHRPSQQYHRRSSTTYRLATIRTLQSTDNRQTNTTLCHSRQVSK